MRIWSGFVCRVYAARVIGWWNVRKCWDSEHMSVPVWHHRRFHEKGWDHIITYRTQMRGDTPNG